MNGYEMLMKFQRKMQDPVFAERFKRIANELNNIPGLQQEILRISQIEDEKKRKSALDRLPDRAKKAATEMVNLINS